MIVDRDTAKSLFGKRDPSDLLDFVRQLSESVDAQTLRLPAVWRDWDERFGVGEGELAALQWTLSGGRDLAVADDAICVQLKRPDIVSQIAGALTQFNETVARVTNGGEAASFHEPLTSFYSTAAERSAAVLFIASRLSS